MEKRMRGVVAGEWGEGEDWEWREGRWGKVREKGGGREDQGMVAGE